MKKGPEMAFAPLMEIGSGTALTQDAMKKDAMGKDGMTNDAMGTDGAAKNELKSKRTMAGGSGEKRSDVAVIQPCRCCDWGDVRHKSRVFS